MARLYQGNFGAGELAPGLWGRIDLDRFSSGLRVCRNMIPLPEGGLTKRPGLEFVGFSLTNSVIDARLIPFVFNNEQTYMVVAEPSLLYFIKDGGVVLGGAGSGSLTVGQDANGVYINDSLNLMVVDGFIAGARLFVLEGGYEEITRRWVRVGDVGDGVPAPTISRVYLIDYVTGSPLATSGWTPNGAIDVRQIYFVGTADGWFSGVDVSELDFTQANDTLFVSHPSGKTKVVTRTADNAWTITDFDPAPGTASVTNLAEGALTGPNYTNSPSFTRATGTEDVEYAVTAIDEETFEESLAALVTVGTMDPTTFAPPQDAGTGCRIEWDAQAGVKTFRIYKGVGGIYGLIGQSEGTVGTIGFNDVGFTPNLSLAPPLEVNPEFNATDKYPGAVELFQQRILFGRTNAELRDWYASRSGSFSSFANTTVSADDDPIEQKIAAKSVQEIRYFVPLRNLVIMTSDAEWGLDNGDSGVITPGSGLVAQSFWGSARVKPVLIGDSAVFVERTGSSLRDLAFSLQNDGFASSNLSLLAKHLFRGRTIKSMCYAETPYQLIFLVMSDGRALSCTYVRDQQIFAWARHDTAGTMLDCASLQENGVDNIYVHIERNNDVNGVQIRVRQIERMKMADPQFLDQGLYLDNSTVWNEPGQYSFLSYDEATAMDIIEGASTTGVQEFELILPDTVNDTLIQFKASANSATTVIDGLVFKATQVGTPSGGKARYQLRRVSPDGTKLELFDWQRFFPANIREFTSVGFITEATTSTKFAHQLAYRDDLVAVRADSQMYTGQTVEDGGKLSVPLDTAAAQIHLGETYTAEIETLDIDSVQDPITGLPVQISSLLIRFNMALQYEAGPEADAMTTRLITQIEEDEEYDIQLGALRGVVEQTLFPNWNRRGRVRVRSVDGFPFQISALIPKVDVGDLEDD